MFLCVLKSIIVLIYRTYNHKVCEVYFDLVYVFLEISSKLVGGKLCPINIWHYGSGMPLVLSCIGGDTNRTCVLNSHVLAQCPI